MSLSQSGLLFKQLITGAGLSLGSGEHYNQHSVSQAHSLLTLATHLDTAVHEGALHVCEAGSVRGYSSSVSDVCSRLKSPLNCKSVIINIWSFILNVN